MVELGYGRQNFKMASNMSNSWCSHLVQFPLLCGAEPVNVMGKNSHDLIINKLTLHSSKSKGRSLWDWCNQLIPSKEIGPSLTSEIKIKM